MRQDKIVQFVCFETTLDNDQFIAQWEQFSKPSITTQEVTLQQSEKNGLFRYLAQYRCTTGEFGFVFSRARRSPHTPATSIKVDQIGGYSTLQSQRTGDAKAGETKVFAFLENSGDDLTVYNKIFPPSKLNIYEAYYENCSHPCILEFFVKNEFVAELVHQLKQHDVTEIRAYKECATEIS